MRAAPGTEAQTLDQAVFDVCRQLDPDALIADELVRRGRVQQAIHALRRGMVEIKDLPLRREFERRIESMGSGR